MKLPTSSFILASLASSALSKVTFDRRQDRQYPAQYEVPDTSVTPQAWTDAYNAAKAQGKIAGIPPSTMDQNGNINYPDNLNNDPGVCSWTTIKCYGPNDIYKAPTNVLGEWDWIADEQRKKERWDTSSDFRSLLPFWTIFFPLYIDNIQPSLIFSFFVHRRSFWRRTYGCIKWSLFFLGSETPRLDTFPYRN